MSGENADGDYNSDIDVDDKKHSVFLEDVLNLSKTQHVKKPSRTEPTLHISEFSLVKSITGNKGAIHLKELTKILQKRPKHVGIQEKVQNAERKVKTLSKPLEKPQAQKLQRAIGFEKLKLRLNRWEPVVTSNRVADFQSFPLPVVEIYSPEKNAPDKWRIKSDLEKKLDAIDSQAEMAQVKTDDQYPLTMEEMLERRRETAKFRAIQSYKEAKSRRHNKIKSKKFHRIQRKEKIKKQLKEFELLQKTNPELALKKLEELERTRAEERMTLRHRNTTQWAKNKQVRAKYDKESRQSLGQQLAISRDLTQKIKPEESSDSENEIQKPNALINSDNPWIKHNKTPTEIDEFISGYRKYWDKENKKTDSELNKEQVKEVVSEIGVKHVDNKQNKMKRKVTNKKTRNPIVSLSTTPWIITDVGDDHADINIDQIFNELENKKKQALNKKYEKLQRDLNGGRNGKKTRRPIKKGVAISNNSDVKRGVKRPIIDEELEEAPANSNGENIPDGNVTKLLSILSGNAQNQTILPKDIDPKKFIHVKPVELDSRKPDLETFAENEENADHQRLNIMEAFEEDDVFQEFRDEKLQRLEKDKAQSVDLTLPGWGAWGGKGVRISNKKKRRFIIRFPKEAPRRDDNKGEVIINENARDRLKEHLVSELPFPFTSVKDFEASIRAPIGNTFVPETAFKKLTRPAVVTKMGKVIEPMTEDVLMKKTHVKKKKRRKF